MPAQAVISLRHGIPLETSITLQMHSYPSIFTIGHKAIQEIFIGPVVIEEKVDGSQLSFGITADRELFIRSKGKDQYPQTDKLFNRAVESILSRVDEMVPGYIYRGEYLNRPHHNVLTYDRTPNGNIVIFDVEDGAGQNFLSPMEKKIAADKLDLETVPLIWNGQLKPEEIVELITGWVRTTASFLGGTLIEGVVVKNYHRYGVDKKILLAKWVREEFKEQHAQVWGSPKTPKPNFIDELGKEYTTEARWHKAIQHLRDNGELIGGPQDIGPLLKEINADVLRECGDEIKDRLFKHFWRDISKHLTFGFPQWYKQQLFESVTENSDQ